MCGPGEFCTLPDGWRFCAGGAVNDTKLISRIFTDERVENFRRRYLWVNGGAGLVAAVTFALLHGAVFPASWSPWIAALHAVCLVALIGETLGVYIVARTLREGWRHASLDSLALLVGVLMGIVLAICSPWGAGLLEESSTVAAFGYLTEAGLLAFVAARVLRLLSFLTRVVRSPLMAFAGSFVGIILFGTLLLLLPGATQPGVSLGPIDAFFMATSATCVTGLVVKDIGTEFTLFGQLVILTLIQIGGLGIMTFAAFFSLVFGRGHGVRDAAAVGEMLNVDFVGRVGRMIAWILGVTIVSETIGTIGMYGHWVDASGQLLPTSSQLYYSVFHSISAFCNAGFSLYGDSMVQFQGDWPVVLSISSLVVVGGIGFMVVVDLVTYRFWAHPAARRISFLRRRVRNQRLPRLTLQTKLVLIATAALLFVGIAGFWILEAGGVLAGRTIGDQLAISIFHGMTPRTAGFNSVDITALKPATLYFTILLMVVGASPGSTGGGLKTTTIVVMVLAVVATLRGRSTEAFKRRIPDALIRKSLVMLFLALGFINAATLALMLSESGGAAGGNYGFEKITFEVVSAFCTVGLSTGITGELTGVGKVIIVLCMFVGRIGPLTLVLAIGRRGGKPFEYPDETVMIG